MSFHILAVTLEAAVDACTPACAALTKAMQSVRIFGTKGHTDTTNLSAHASAADAVRTQEGGVA